MKKYVFVTICIILMLSVSSCKSPMNQTNDYSDSRQETMFPSENTDEHAFQGQDVILSHMAQAMFNDDDITAKNMLATFLEAVETADQDMIMQLFAPNIASTTAIEEHIDGIINYYKGTTSYIEYVGGMGSRSQNDGITTDHYMATFKVSTSEQEYRIAIKICYEDTADSGNVGIHSIYIIKAENADPVFAYWGGHVWDNGIIIEDVNNS